MTTDQMFEMLLANCEQTQKEIPSYEEVTIKLREHIEAFNEFREATAEWNRLLRKGTWSLEASARHKHAEKRMFGNV